MNPATELSTMANKAFDTQLMNTLLTAYQEILERINLTFTEQDYIEAMGALPILLNGRQKTELAKMEHLFIENAKYIMPRGFGRGVYLGFEHFFTDKVTRFPFDDSIQKQILTSTNPPGGTEYSRRNEEINQIYEALCAQLTTQDREHILSVYSAWDDRLYGVLRQSFYLGYHYAISIFEEVDSTGVTPQIAKKIRITERELGCTQEE